MTKPLRFCLLLLWIISSSTMMGQWTQIGNYVGSSTDNNQLAIKGDTLFMGVKIPSPTASKLFYTLLSSTTPVLSEYQTWGIVGEIDDAVIWKNEFTSLTNTNRLVSISNWYLAPYRKWSYLSATPSWTMNEMDMQVHNDTAYIIGNTYNFNTSTTHVEVKKYDGSTWSSLGVTTDEILNEKANLIFVNNIPHISFATSSGDAVVLKLQSGQWTAVGPNSSIVSGAESSQIGYMNNKLYLIYTDANDFFIPKMKVFENGNWNNVPNPNPYQGSEWKLSSFNNNLYLNQKGEHLQRFDGITWNIIGGSSTGYTKEFQTHFDHYVDQNGDVYMSLTDDSQGKSTILKYECSTTLDTRQISACNAYTSPSGRYIWNQSGTYFDTISNNMGCHLALTIQLTINAVDTTVTTANNVLTANENNATYQWVDCSTGIAISGATSQSYTVYTTGTYKCEITKGSCTVSTSCQNMIVNGITNTNNKYSINVFPNPAINTINIESNYTEVIDYLILDITGKLMFRGSLNNTLEKVNISQLQKGLYILKITSDNLNITKSIIKN